MAARDLAKEAGLETNVVSTGGSPDMWLDDGLDVVTEYRAGTYVYFDRSPGRPRDLRLGRLRAYRACRRSSAGQPPIGR